MIEHTAYCSWCLRKTKHERVARSRVGRDEYACTYCHMPTHRCRWCEHMACGLADSATPDLRDRLRRFWGDELCAEHNGTIASFETCDWRLDDLADYQRIFRREVWNLRKVGTIAAWAIGGALVFGPFAYATAPRIAAALGRLGLLGAAGTGTAIRTLHGAALLNASLAAIGGTPGVVLLTAAGAALGAHQGAAVSHAYLGRIKDFEVRRIKSGDGPAVLFVNGFLSQDKDECSEWEHGLSGRFDHGSWYHIRWESKTLKKLGTYASGGVGTAILARAAGSLARRASFNARMPLATAWNLAALARNAWHVALVRAGMTGILLADLMARTKHPEGFILMGNSLGARVIYHALEALATSGRVIVRDAYLVGGAVGTKKDWVTAQKAVSGRIFNCYSTNDLVLKVLYRIGVGALSEPIGLSPIALQGEEQESRIVNVDVSDLVSGHMQYKPNLGAILDRAARVESLPERARALPHEPKGDDRDAAR